MFKYLVSTVVFVASCSPAMAQQPNCASSSDVYDIMSQRFGEVRQTIGVTQGGALVEQWANEATGSWTIVVTDPTSRLTCIVADGVGFDYVSPPNV